LVGISQSSHINQLGKLLLTVDSTVGFFNRDKYYETFEPIPIFNRARGSLAGVNINKQKEFVNALAKLRFHVMYEPGKNSKWENNLRSKGKSEQEIQGMSQRFRKDQRMKMDEKGRNEIERKGIRWVANDPSALSFTDRATNEELTIVSYYKNQYNLDVDPNLPIIHLGHEQWFPIQFLFQVQEKAVPDDKTKIDALKYNDEFASTDRINQIQRLRQQADQGDELTHKLNEFHFGVSPDPLTVNAKIIEQPNLLFHGRNPARVNDGSWNLKGDIRWIRYAMQSHGPYCNACSS
jgi:hypothetical protein